jgi:hypothetical protein
MGLHEVIDTVHRRLQEHGASANKLVEHRDKAMLAYDKLFDRIDEWLAPHVASGKIERSISETKITDARFGEMDVHSLSIRPHPVSKIAVVISPTGTSCASIKDEVRIRRADTTDRVQDYFLYRLLADGDDASWFIARRNRNPGRPKPLDYASFEDAICTLLLA